MRKRDILGMADKELLRAYTGKCHHEGDDFSMTEYTDRDREEAGIMRIEILRRMSQPWQSRQQAEAGRNGGIKRTQPAQRPSRVVP